MMSRPLITRSGLVAFCLTLVVAIPWPSAGFAATTNTAQILAKTTAALPRCLRWRLRIPDERDRPFRLIVTDRSGGT